MEESGYHCGCSISSSLQWGHGDEAVEELGLVGAGLPWGPLQWGHGDEAVEEEEYQVNLDGTVMLLQWGHGDEAVEESVNIDGVLVDVKLQWGHGDEAVEELTICCFLVPAVKASMGPRR